VTTFTRGSLKPAAEGQKRKSENRKVLIFDRMFPERLADVLQKAKYDGVAAQQAGLLRSFAASTEDLNRLRAEHLVSKFIVFNENLKPEIHWDELPKDWKGATALVLVTRKGEKPV